MDYSTLPDGLRNVLLEQLPKCDRGLLERHNELPHADAQERRLAAALITAAMTPEARAALEGEMDRMWEYDRQKNAGMAQSKTNEEIVIGSGYHAAVYCAVRARMGKPKPLVIEQEGRVGGALAISRGPTFYANSRNRAGDPNVPGEGDGLNVIPGAVVQPSMISADEFQTNADLAFAIRLTLAMHAKVATAKEVLGFEGYIPSGGSRREPRVSLSVRDKDGMRDVRLRTKRMIDARGLGTEPSPGPSDRAMTFGGFMRWVDDEQFPLRGMKRVAVIGGGDSAKCAVEALFGMGPAKHWSIPDLDAVERCDWYCRLPSTCEEFRTSARSRYKRIAPLLPPSGGGIARLRILRQMASISPGYRDVVVNGRRYDLAISCTGYVPTGLPANEPFVVGREQVALKVARYLGDAFIVGARMRLQFSEEEQTRPYSQIPSNTAAMWRLGPRTATLAASLA